LHHGRKEIQPASDEIRQFYARAGAALKHPLVEFDANQRRLVAAGLADAVAQHRYTCYACAVLPDHVHMLIRKHRHQAEDMIPNLQQSSRLRLRNTHAVPADHPVWGGPGWKVFLDHPDDVRRTITYIEQNPAKLRLPQQRWPFVQEYNGWPLHPGHSPNSPYAKRLRNYRG
jgi:REP element-mobilizing transposase RayT